MVLGNVGVVFDHGADRFNDRGELFDVLVTNANVGFDSSVIHSSRVFYDCIGDESIRDVDRSSFKGADFRWGTL